MKSVAVEFSMMLVFAHELSRLQLRFEQLQLHLESLPDYSTEARAVAADLALMRRQITMLKLRCCELDETLGFDPPTAQRLH